MRGIEWEEMYTQCVRAGLGLEQMMNYTPREIEIVLNGITLRKQDELYIKAWELANIINYTGRTKKLIKPEDLVRVKQERTKQQLDIRAEWERILNTMEVQ